MLLKTETHGEVFMRESWAQPASRSSSGAHVMSPVFLLLFFSSSSAFITPRSLITRLFEFTTASGRCLFTEPERTRCSFFLFGEPFCFSSKGQTNVSPLGECFMNFSLLNQSSVYCLCSTLARRRSRPESHEIQTIELERASQRRNKNNHASSFCQRLCLFPRSVCTDKKKKNSYEVESSSLLSELN